MEPTKIIYLLSRLDSKVIDRLEIPAAESPRLIKWGDRFFIRTGCITDYAEEFPYGVG